ncbi:hypothetical protein Tco_0889502 [Tanacetum coccineum]
MLQRSICKNSRLWATAYVHNRSVRFKMNNKKHILGLDQFRDFLQICPKVGNKKFVEPPIEKEILIFLAHLGHSGDIRKITDVNVNKLHQPWRSFADIINKCLSGKPSYDSLRLSQAQILWGTIPPKTKGSKKKANTDIITQQKPPTAPKEKKSGKAKQKTAELETISEADLTEAEQLKIITKRSRQETHSSHASGSGADEGTGVTPGVPDAPDYDSEDDISWKSSDDDQADEQAEDDEDAGKNDVNETTQDDEDDDDHDDDEKVQNDDEHDVDETVQEDDGEEQTESDVIWNECLKDQRWDEDATYEDDVEDTHVTLTPVILMVKQQSSSVSYGFVSNMLNPNQDTGVDDIFRQHTEATSLIDTSVTAIMEPSFTAQINRPPTPSTTANQLFLDSIDDWNEENIKEQSKRQLYKALVEAYEADKILLDTYGDTVTIKRPRDGADDDQEPSAGTDRGSKRRRSGKEPASTSAPSETTTKENIRNTTSTGSKTHTKSASQSAPVGEAMHSTDVFKGPADQEFETGVQDEQAEEEVQHLPDWFQKPTRLPSPDHAWNTSVPAVHESVQPGFTSGTTGTLEVEVYKATTKKLDWINPEGRQYPHDLRQPLPLVPNSQGRRVIPFHHFINNDLEYLRGGVSSRKYSTSVTKTKAADYGHIKWIEDLVPNSMWSQTIVKYDKFALWGVSHWGKKRRQFYAFAALRESARDVYSKRRIIAVTKVEIVEWHDYKHLDWITVRRDDDVLYKFKEGDFHRLRIQDIEDMLLLLVQGKVTNLSVEERIAFNVSLRMFTRRVVIQRRVEDLQLGVESYQKKLNLTKPDTYRS